MTPYIGPWETGRVHRADCMEALRQLPDACVDAVVTDPPYFLPATHYCTRTRFPRSLSDLSMVEHFYRDVFAQARRVLRETGVFYVFCDGQSYPIFFCLLYPLARRVIQLVWDKMVSVNGYTWRHQHEVIAFAEMDETRAVPTGDGDILKCRAVPMEERLHPAEKPVALLRQLIRKSVPRGGAVLDPFSGSGTTIIAAEQEGCVGLGFETDERYVGLSNERASAEREKMGEVGKDDADSGQQLGLLSGLDETKEGA